MEATNQLLPLNIVARRLRVPVRWLRAEAEAARIPCLRACNQFLCDVAAVEAALLQRARQHASLEPNIDSEGAALPSLQPATRESSGQGELTKNY